jgi:hypothetical protein
MRIFIEALSRAHLGSTTVDFGGTASPPLEERVGERRPYTSNPKLSGDSRVYEPLPRPLPASGEKEMPGSA